MKPPEVISVYNHSWLCWTALWFRGPLFTLRLRLYHYKKKKKSAAQAEQAVMRDVLIGEFRESM